MDCYLYKFSVKPLPQARRIFRVATVAVLICVFGTIYAFAYGIESEIPIVPRMIGTVVVTLILFHALQYFFWLAGKYKMTEAGILCKCSLFKQKRIRWETICSIKRTTMLQGRSDHIDVFVFCLDNAYKGLSKIIEHEQTADYYFRRQKYYFVIMYSKDREVLLSDRGFQIEFINAKKR